MDGAARLPDKLVIFKESIGDTPLIKTYKYLHVIFTSMADLTPEDEKRLDRFYLSAALALLVTIFIVCHPVSASCAYGDHTTYQSCYDAAHAYCIQHDLRPCGDFASDHCNSCVTPTPTPTPSCSETCYYVCEHGFSSCALGTADLNLAWALWGGAPSAQKCTVSGWQWDLLSQQYPCSVPTPTITVTPPTPTPTLTAVPYPTGTAYIPVPAVVKPSLAITAYPTVTNIPTIATIATIPLVLYNDTDIQNTAKNVSVARWFVEKAEGIEDAVMGMFYAPFYTIVLSPLLTLTTNYTSGMNQGFGILNLFASYPKLFLYSGLVLVARLPLNVQLLGAGVLWLNLIFRGYDFLKGRHR